MSRLILTFDDIAGGALKGRRLADHVLPFGWQFVWGPLPSPGELENEARIDGHALSKFCARFDTIELWADPEPNAQLQLIWLLDHLRPHPDVVAKLTLVPTNTGLAALGQRNGAGSDPYRSIMIISKSLVPHGPPDARQHLPHGSTCWRRI